MLSRRHDNMIAEAMDLVEEAVMVGMGDPIRIKGNISPKKQQSKSLREIEWKGGRGGKGKDRERKRGERERKRGRTREGKGEGERVARCQIRSDVQIFNNHC